ncbi:probable phytol kinase 1, chloroplastic isoform X3 [Trifolium pratense]|uniref:probable phytol kinase 1, chloroplastic isoform X3 n=1 Tax=Trifolium pratense TaxID=57577 RepID=UPI001E69560B|nr:probable phytol kinase 1, chloroplastic isoform X3 [Trifolium pratense]
MTLISSHLFPFSAVNRRSPATSTTTTTTTDLFSCNKPTTTNNTVKFLYSPSLHRCIRLDERFVTRFIVPANAQDLIYNAGATVGVLGGAYALVSAFDDLTRKNILNQDSNSPDARYFAAFVPLVNFLRLLVNGFSLVSDQGLIKSVTRQGDPKELLRGPLYYVGILILCAVVFWRNSPIGVVSLAMMCGGDGVADIIGRRYGSMKIPYNQSKSWAGSIAMLIFGFLVSIGMLYYYSFLGHVQFDWGDIVPKVAFIAFVATVVESLPITEVVDDNISVPLVTMAMAFFTLSNNF